MTNTHDIDAMRAVIDDVVAETESLSIDGAIEMLETLQALAGDIRRATGAIETHLCDVLESPREINGKLYEIKNAGKWRPQHDQVKDNVRRAARVDAGTGEIRDSAEAVELAVEIMYDLFVSPSTMPKTGGLDRLGLDKSDVADFERQGKRVSVTDVG